MKSYGLHPFPSAASFLVLLKGHLEAKTANHGACMHLPNRTQCVPGGFNNWLIRETRLLLQLPEKTGNGAQIRALPRFREFPYAASSRKLVRGLRGAWKRYLYSENKTRLVQKEEVGCWGRLQCVNSPMPEVGGIKHRVSGTTLPRRHSDCSKQICGIERQRSTESLPITAFTSAILRRLSPRILLVTAPSLTVWYVSMPIEIPGIKYLTLRLYIP